MLKRLAALLPSLVQQELRRWKCWWDWKRGRFRSAEPEFERLGDWVQSGDWVLDIGANVGYYTMRLSELCGPDGRVFAFEPIDRTVEALSFMMRFARCRNISIFNAAVSSSACVLRFSIGNFPTGLPNYFEARAVKDGAYEVYATSIDALELPKRVALAKIDAEGGEQEVLRGMEKLLRRDHPVLIIEGKATLAPYLAQFGYEMAPRQENSPNLVFMSIECPANAE